MMIMRMIRFAVCLFTAVLCLSFSIALANDNGKITVWQLNQDIDQWGPQEILVSKDGLRIDDPIRHFTMLTKAPDWTIVYFSDKRKLIATCPLAKFDGGLARRLNVITIAFIGSEDSAKIDGWEKKGTEQYCGQTCTKWALKDEIARAKQLAGYMILEAPGIPCSPQASKILARYIHLPTFGHVCMLFRKGNTKPKPAYQTLSTKKLSVPASRFVPPKGYTASTPEKVMFEQQDFDF